MSILLALAAQTAAAPPPPEVARDIVVIGRKMKVWKGGVSKVGDKMVCKTSKSTGDKALDAIRCGAMLSCLAPFEPRLDALFGSKLATGEKRRRFDVMMTGIEPCLTDYGDAAIARLAEQRAGA